MSWVPTPAALLVMDNVEILKERSPLWVLVPRISLHESNHGAVRFGDRRAGGVRAWVSKSARPRSQAIRLDVTVEESVCVHASGSDDASYQRGALQPQAHPVSSARRYRTSLEKWARHPPHRSWRWRTRYRRMPDRHRARSLKSLWMSDGTVRGARRQSPPNIHRPSPSPEGRARLPSEDREPRSPATSMRQNISRSDRQMCAGWPIVVLVAELASVFLGFASADVTCHSRCAM